MKGNSAEVTTIDQYIDGCPPEVRAKLTQIRETIRGAAPEATEKISYRLPTFYYHGNLVHFAAFPNHIGFYPTPTGISAFKKELARYKGAKGSVQFPIDEPVPLDLIARIVRFRVAENAKVARKRPAKAAGRGTKTVIAIAVAALVNAVDAQAVQYRSPAGVEYRSLADTGGIARAESAVTADPRNVEKLLALGLAQAGMMQYREAIGTFTRAIALAPNNPVLYRWRGHRYLSLREFERARADLERGLALDSLCYGCLYHLGIVRYVGGDFAGAANAFQRALPIAPDSGEFAGSVDWLWSSLSRAGRAADARAVLDRHADAITAKNAYERRVQLYRGRIGPEAVITPADTAGVQAATLSYGLGNWYLIRGDTAQARRWFDRAVRTTGWPAFGFIAAEAELRRLR